MKITSIAQAYQVYNTKPAVSGKKVIKGEKKDDLNVSSQAREFQSALKAVLNSPDIREDKVEAIKQQMDNGSYNISAEDIADKLTSNLF